MVEDHKNLGAVSDDGLSVSDIVRFLRVKAWLIGGFLLLGGVAGLLLSYTQPREWEATSVLQIGQLDDGGGNPSLIDPPSRAVQRVNIEPFRDQVLHSLSLPVGIGQNADGDLVRKTLNAEVVLNTDLIRLSVRGHSPESAKKALQTAQDKLIAIHAGVEQQTVKLLQDRLKSINADIATALAKRDRIESSTSLGTRAGGAGPADVLLGNMLDVSEQGFLDSLKNSQAQLVRQLSDTRTFNTRSLAGIAISQNPVSPRRPFYGLLGGLVGVLIGLLIAGNQRAKRR